MSDTLKYTSIQQARAHGSICAYCHITGAEKKLLFCAGCKAQYCSRECQKKDWTSHKVLCNKAENVLATVVSGGVTFAGSTTGPRNRAGLPGAINSWLKCHKAVLIWACFNAFELNDHPERGLDHVFLLELEIVDPPTTGAEIQLHITKAELVTHHSLIQAHPGVVAMFIRQAEAYDKEVKVPGTIGTVSTNMLLHCGEEWQSLIMKWYQEELDEKRREKDWMPVLMSMTMGKKEFEIVDGYLVRQ